MYPIETESYSETNSVRMPNRVTVHGAGESECPRPAPVLPEVELWLEPPVPAPEQSAPTDNPANAN